MRVIQILFDTLCRRMLAPYGCDWTHTPNLKRLAEQSAVFDNAYVGSMPCMPARRELHTGRLNFLHRSWGPLEPFDDSAPELLKQNGVYEHMATDHQHYWEDGGATYHNRYSSYELFRGQEGDLWKGEVKDPDIPEHYGRSWRSDAVNRKYMRREEDQPQTKTFQAGLEFIETNKDEDRWHLTIETSTPTSRSTRSNNTRRCSRIVMTVRISIGRITRRWRSLPKQSSTRDMNTPRCWRCAMRIWARCST